MSVVPIRRPVKPRPRLEQKATRMYAIAFDLDTRTAEALLGANWRGCYEQIGRVLNDHGFHGQQGSVYFGQPGSNPVLCVKAVQAIERRYPWFPRVIRDLRMLRIEEENDLLPALSGELPLAANE